MTIDEPVRDELIRLHIEKARETASDVRFLIDNSKFFLAVNRIYYGMFYILSALALKSQFQTSKHQQLIGWFNKNFIKTGKLEEKIGEIIHNAYDMRSKSDYDIYTCFSNDEVENMYIDMQMFISSVEKMITDDD